MNNENSNDLKDKSNDDVQKIIIIWNIMIYNDDLKDNDQDDLEDNNDYIQNDDNSKHNNDNKEIIIIQKMGIIERIIVAYKVIMRIQKIIMMFAFYLYYNYNHYYHCQ